VEAVGVAVGPPPGVGVGATVGSGNVGSGSVGSGRLGSGSVGSGRLGKGVGVGEAVGVGVGAGVGVAVGVGFGVGGGVGCGIGAGVGAGVGVGSVGSATLNVIPIVGNVPDPQVVLPLEPGLSNAWPVRVSRPAPEAVPVILNTAASPAGSPTSGLSSVGFLNVARVTPPTEPVVACQRWTEGEV
jgi:hypothetical protein